MKGSGGEVYPRRCAVAIEPFNTQNAANIAKWRDQVVLGPGESRSTEIIYKFIS
jgi:galactose mutarotase-like enzyme